jgi:hypothetical protein
VSAWAFRYPSEEVAPLLEEVGEAFSVATEVWGAVMTRMPADPG